MEPNVFQLLLIAVFPPGLLPTSSPVQRQYHLITEPMSWPNAQTYCRDNYDDLATVENNMDLGQIQTEAQRLVFTSDTWVGLYRDIYSWRCSRDNVPLGWTSWGQGKPVNAIGLKECVGISHAGGWFDSPCLTSFPFMCYNENKSGSDQFIYYSALKTWKDAQTYCRQSHTDLACPSDDTQNTIVQSKVTTDWTWIGFYRDGWKWSDNTRTSSIMWAPTQPDNAGGHQFCVRLIGDVFNGNGTSGWFDDIECSGQRAFFCESLLVKKKVVRLVVQSDQDMNDPTMQAALLEKMQQMLMTQGIAVNATLRWREQSDGSVFNKQEEKKSENVENNTVTTCEIL